MSKNHNLLTPKIRYDQQSQQYNQPIATLWYFLELVINQRPLVNTNNKSSSNRVRCDCCYFPRRNLMIGPDLAAVKTTNAWYINGIPVAAGCISHGEVGRFCCWLFHPHCWGRRWDKIAELHLNHVTHEFTKNICMVCKSIDQIYTKTMFLLPMLPVFCCLCNLLTRHVPGRYNSLSET